MSEQQTQTPSENPPLQTSAIPDGELRTIPIAELHESPWNPRQHFPEAELAELVESMKTSGFREWLPLMVRPHPEDFGYEIGAGHRRRRAAELAGITQIPCVVREMSDEQFLDVLNFDNTGREDVHPLHEAAGWRQWMEKTGKGVLDIAARIGQSKEYVYQRLKYAALIPEAQAAFLDGKLTAGHAILIARREDQKKWLKFCLAPVNYSGVLPSVRALNEALHRDAYIDLRDNCPFDRMDKTLLSGAGPCEECPKRAANIPGFEFAEGGAEADVCTDRVCHGQKVDNHLYRIRTEVYTTEGHYPLQVSWNWSTKRKGVYPHTDWDAVKAGASGAQTALVVEGQNLGHVIQVRRKDAAPAPSPETGLSQPVKPSTQSKAEQERKAAEQQQKEKAKVELAIRRQILRAITAKVGGLSRADLEELLVFILNTGDEAIALCPLHGVEFKPALPKLKEADLFQVAVELPVADELEDWNANRPPTKLLALAKRYKVDAAKIRKEAEDAAKPKKGGSQDSTEPSAPTAAPAPEGKPRTTARAQTKKAKPPKGQKLSDKMKQFRAPKKAAKK